MKSSEYRVIVARIVRNGFRKRFPGIKQKKEIDELSNLIAKNVYARLHGANVDNVESPLWRDNPEYSDKQPTVDASEILKGE